VPETLLKAGAELRDPPRAYLGFASSMLILSLFAAGTSNRRFRGAYSVYWLAALLSYLGVTTLSRIAARP